jgi:hypothetical protein
MDFTVFWEGLKAIVKQGNYSHAHEFCALPTPKDFNELMVRQMMAIQIMQ